MRRLPLCALAVLLLVPAGCQKLNFAKEATLETATRFLEYTFDAPQGEQNINVKASADEPINVWVVLDEDRETSLTSVERRQKPAKALAGQESSKEIDFDATIPAKKSFAVVVGPSKEMRRDTTVKLNVRSK